MPQVAQGNSKWAPPTRPGSPSPPSHLGHERPSTKLAQARYNPSPLHPLGHPRAHPSAQWPRPPASPPRAAKAVNKMTARAVPPRRTPSGSSAPSGGGEKHRAPPGGGGKRRLRCS
eukprot:6108480-Pyramimonas_sp.AAC.1